MNVNDTLEYEIWKYVVHVVHSVKL